MNKDLLQDFIRDEFLSCPVKNKSEALAECAGIFLGLKNFSSTSKIFIARRLKLKLWKISGLDKNWNIKILHTRQTDSSIFKNKKLKHVINLNFISKKISCTKFKDIMLKTALKTKNYWAFLRGLWGCSGNLYFPKSGYYLNLNSANPKSQPEIFNLTRKFLTLTDLHWSSHKNNFTLRNQEDIVTFMGNINLSGVALKLEERAIINEVKNHANRLSNSEAANIKRSVEAALEQVKLAHYIIENDLLKILPENLRELVLLRLKFPELNLSELGEKITQAKNSKTAVKYRWSRIKKILEQNNF